MSYYTVYYYHFEDFHTGSRPILEYKDIPSLKGVSDFISELEASGYGLISLCLKGDLPFCTSDKQVFDK